MIPRYSRMEMAQLWSREHSYSLWLKVELLALEGMEAIGKIPPGTTEIVRSRATVDVERIAVLEAQVHHEVIAFLTSVSEQVGIEGRFIHYGMTSSDVLDTALAVQTCQAIDLLLAEIDDLTNTLRQLAEEHRGTLCLARTHGRGAEPTTFGLKLAGFFAEFRRSARRLAEARREMAVCKLAGAVGTYATIDPRVENFVAAALSLTPETVATQAVARDRHASVMTGLAILAGGIERLATELRHLQRQEVEEVAEGFSATQKGSSAMPHKRNPIFSENLTGLARLIRASAIPVLENIALWHERDMSHSSVERVALPDAFSLCDFALARLSGIMRGLKVRPDRMRANLDAMRGVFASQRILLSLIDAGLSRERAYAMVQQAAARAVDQGMTFRDAALLEPELTTYISVAEIDVGTDPACYLTNVDFIFARVFAEL
ncbi:adenylosuccinate lyase [Rhizobium leguminosarum]|uniref:adenylosuccinate lyase n=1 Tax=Rhizobium leguminosarum TaxID=384 RepID=UPI001C9608D4|nr:adenylosuccinate lyase [Rhizobium leguminosarum]MBY5551819.1 adenylosuccinate lyase [Rhizobium leguminosarum]